MSYRFSPKRAILAAAALLTLSTGLKAAVTADELRQEVEDLRKRLYQKEQSDTPVGRVDALAGRKFGPNATVTSRSGKLQIGALFQLWTHELKDKDKSDVFSTGNGRPVSMGGYIIGRTELRFTMDIHENVLAYVSIDPAREITSYPPYPSNQGLFKSMPYVNPEYDLVNGPGLGETWQHRSVQVGGGQPNRLLLDAFINYHGVVPHHDFTLGQFRPKMGEEGPREDGYLDFIERAMVNQDNAERDLGVQAHGSWIDCEHPEDGRVQYWLGVFDGAGNFFNSAHNWQIGDVTDSNVNADLTDRVGQRSNRTDDNDAKDFLGSLMVRPIWNRGCWGSLELGYSGRFGKHGKGSDADPLANPTPNIGHPETAAIQHAAWLMYKPMGPLRGLWLRGEYGYQKDRTVPGSVRALGIGSGDFGQQTRPAPFHRDGFYGAFGYRLSESYFGEMLEKKNFFTDLIRPVELKVRYEQFYNIIMEDLVSPDTHTDLFRTNVLTVGVNMYTKGYKHRLSYDFMVVDEETRGSNPERGLREVRNNVMLLQYQLMF
ncbi:MAG TPA: hypothetical protein VGP72_13735 [Planctomycetota bacterium]|jgi:hypothetical protein